MYSAESTRALPRVGFPIRKSRDQRLVSTSPGLIAAAHVLHRLLAPRHPPYALVLLIVKNTCLFPLWSFQGARRPVPARRSARMDGLSKLNSVRCKSETQAKPVPPPLSASQAKLTTKRRGRRNSRRARDLDDRQADHQTVRTACRGNGPGIPRKEVIQPQLPLRLPCYDFTPIIDPTFDGSLPCGLGHRLRVLPTFVV